MKKIIFSLLLLFLVKVAVAQKDSLSFDERNKYIYYKVVEQPGTSTDTLQTRASYFLKTAYTKIKLSKTDVPANFKGNGIFMIYNGTLVKTAVGQIAYTCVIECKDQKYRYWVTDFVFTPYKTDRYGNAVPEQGVEIPLEDAAKLGKKQQDDFLNQAASFSRQFGDKLKVYMLRLSAAPPKGGEKKVISTKNW